ncbi:hypothetical protein HK44_004555 [Pseudomonas fluorescens HK44]|uniref:Uncharacterized protein n=1 Tax=Pseudomonas fluorescens HK44 TaxID=1042209 RepID=A0A010SSX4_PSEFL|nr:hypothetical protein HK44_004555 [Pseudomonas fluorescens HK44]
MGQILPSPFGKRVLIFLLVALFFRKNFYRFPLLEKFIFSSAIFPLLQRDASISLEGLAEAVNLLTTPAGSR